MDDLHVDTWMSREHPIFIGRANQVEDTRSNTTIGGLHVDSPRHMMKIRRLDHKPRLTCDRGAIAARSWPDCRGIVAHSSHNWSHDCCILMAHDHCVIVAINRPLSLDQTVQIFWAKFPLKTDVLCCFLLNS